MGEGAPRSRPPETLKLHHLFEQEFGLHRVPPVHLL